MAAKSTYASNRTLEHLLRSGNVYLALFITLPADSGSGGAEVSGGSYARQLVTFTAASGGQSVNSADIVFPQATASWGTVTGFGIYDALTGGNPVYLDPLPNGSIDVGFNGSYGDQLLVPAGALIISES